MVNLMALFLFILNPMKPGPQLPPDRPRPPIPEHIPLFITGYSWDPTVDSLGCDHDCSVTAMGVRTSPELFGWTAACPQKWMGWTIHIRGLGSFWCIDNFGKPVNRKLVYIEGIGWAYRIDVALEDPYSIRTGLYFNPYQLEWVEY